MKTIVILVCGCIVSLKAFTQMPIVAKAETGLYGYKNSNQKFIIEPKFQLAFPFGVNGMAKVVQKNLWGIIDASGKFVISPQYEYIGWADDQLLREYQTQASQDLTKLNFYETYNGLIAFKKAEKWGLLNLKGKVVLPAEFSSITYPRNRLIIVSKHDVLINGPIYGWLNHIGESIVIPTYHYLTPNFDYTRFIVGKDIWDKAGHSIVNFGVLGPGGEKIVPIQYRAIRSYQDYFLVQNFQHQWQVYDQQGQPIFGQTWQQIKSIDNKTAIVRTKGKWGVIDISGQILIEPIYMEITRKDANSYWLTPFQSWQLFDAKGKIINELELDEILAGYQTDPLIRYSTKGQYGLLNRKGQWATKPIYTAIGKWKNNKLFLQDTSYQSYIIDSEQRKTYYTMADSIVVDTLGFSKIRKKLTNLWGVAQGTKITILPEYEDIKTLTANVFAVKSKNKWGLMNEFSNWKYEPDFEEVGPLYHHYLIVKQQGSWGVFDILRSRWSIEPVFNHIKMLLPHVALGISAGELHLLDIRNKQVLDNPDSIQVKKNGIIQAYKNRLTGLYKGSQLIIPVEYISIAPCGKDSIFTAYKEGYYFFYTHKGTLILKTNKFQEVGISQENHIAVRVDKNWGYINHGGNMRVSARYSAVKDFSQGRAAVKLNNKWAFIDTGENLVIKPHYEQAESFENGWAPVKKNNKWGVIDLQNKELIPFRYDRIEKWKDGLWITTMAGYKGIISAQGKEIIYPRYDEINIEKNVFLVRKGSTWGVIDYTGFEKIAPIYNQIVPLEEGRFLVRKKPDVIVKKL